MATARHLHAVPDPEPALAYEALLDLLAEDGEVAARFESVCRRYVIVPDSEVLAVRSALVRRGEHHRYERVEAAFYSLALEERPESWAAGRERLWQLRGNRSAVGAPTATTAVEDLVATETVWLRELGLLAEDPPDYSRLREVSAKVWTELRWRGRDFEPEQFSDCVYEVLCIVFPQSPAAGWDYAWSKGLFELAEKYLEEHNFREALPADEEAEYVLRADRAMQHSDRSGYRQALREWLEAARDAARDAACTDNEKER